MGLAAPTNVKTMAQHLFGTPKLQVDEAVNDSDKTFTVPANKIWIVNSIWVELISTASAGTRQMVVQIQDGAADVIGEMRAGVTQIASLTKNYMFGQGVPDLVALRDTTFISTPLPPIVLPETFKVRVFDKAAIAAAADDMVVQMMVNELDEI